MVDTGLTTSHRSGEFSSERDQTIRNTAIRLLRSSGYRSLWKLDCEVKDRVVIISGMVPSFFLKQIAQTAILKVEKINGVKKLVEVKKAPDDSIWEQPLPFILQANAINNQPIPSIPA